MKTVLTLAAVSALTFAAMDADAQTRRRGADRAAEPAPAPAPYRLIGPGSAQAATPATPATPAEGGAAAEPATPASPAEPTAPRPTPGGVDATPPVAPATPGGASTVQPATPATPTTAAPGGSTAETDGDEAEATDEAAEATPEQTRAQAALSTVLGQLASGNVDYSKMNTETATRVRAQQPSLTPALTQYGAVRTITPLGERGGSQRFRVAFANGEAVFVIATNAEGLITALGVES